MVDRRDKEGFDEDMALTGQAIVRAIVEQQAEAGAPIDPDVVVSALMMVAAGLLSNAPSLTNPRVVRLKAEAFGKMLREMAIADRAAADANEPTFLRILGVGVAPGKDAKSTHR